MPVKFTKKGKGADTEFDKHLSTEPIIKTVDVTTNDGATLSSTTEKIGEVTLASAVPNIPFASVTYLNGYTKNVGNFESFKVQVSVTIPCAVDKLQKGYEVACGFVEKALTAKLEEIENDLK